MGRAISYAPVGGSRDIAATPRLDEKKINVSDFITVIEFSYLENFNAIRSISCQIDIMKKNSRNV
ncbi:MAG: hypothetical protein ACLR5M_09520 [Bifidobacterium longum]